MSRVERIENELISRGYHKIREVGSRNENGSTDWLSWWYSRTLPVVLIVWQYGDTDGIEVYGPLDRTNSMDALIAAIPTA